MSAGSHTRLGRCAATARNGWLGGVCAGIARRYGVDPALVRLAFVIATAAGGFGVALYLLAWLVIPAGDAPRRRRLPTGRGAVEVAFGTGLLLLSVLLTFRALGIWFSDAIVWPLVLIAERRRADLARLGRRRSPSAGAERACPARAPTAPVARPRRPPSPPAAPRSRGARRPRSRAPASASRW